MKKRKHNSFFVKRNRCPYCTYPCDSAFVNPSDPEMKESDKPYPGCISFCLMCCEPSTWDDNMKLIKLDIKSIPDIVERNRLKLLGSKMEEFWETHHDNDINSRRAMYLKRMDQRCRS